MAFRFRPAALRSRHAQAGRQRMRRELRKVLLRKEVIHKLPRAGGSFPACTGLSMSENTPTPDPLNEKLKSWNVSAPLPPRFQENVWKRVTALDKSPATPFWRALEERLARAFLRPAFTSAYLAVLLMVGLGNGFWQARAKTTEWDKALAEKYVQAVDPYQMPRE